MGFGMAPAVLLSLGEAHCRAVLRRFVEQASDRLGRGEEPGDPDWLGGCVAALGSHESAGARGLGRALSALPPLSAGSLGAWSRALADPGDGGGGGDGGCFGVTSADSPEPKGRPRREVLLVLDSVRSVFNVGCLLRSAEAMGAAGVRLCGYTPTPDDPRMARTALGSERWVPWERHESTIDCLDGLAARGVAVYALETAPGAVAPDELPFSPSPCALVLGNERHGLGGPVLARARRVLAFPMAGRKNSLNVAVCGSMALWALLRAGGGRPGGRRQEPAQKASQTGMTT